MSLKKNLAKMNHGSLFSGVGGFDLAAEWMGWNNIFHCEWNPFGQKVLKYYWPKAISYGDITKTDFTIHRGNIDILTGGFPCQPYSAAGKRKGKEDERHLWPEMLRAIQEIQPTWIVGENVSGLVNWNGGMVFDEVQADLEAEGYEVIPFLLPACGVNAPHKRERVWFVAYTYLQRNNRNKRTEKNNMAGKQSENTQQTRNKRTGKTKRFSKEWITSNNSDTGIESVRRERENSIHGLKNATNTCGKGLQGRKSIWDSENNRWENNTEVRPSGCYQRHSRKTWQDFPTKPPICSRNDGISSRLDGITFSKWRNESIKAYGNAIVPQVVLEIFKAIKLFELTIADID